MIALPVAQVRTRVRCRCARAATDADSPCRHNGTRGATTGSCSASTTSQPRYALRRRISISARKSTAPSPGTVNAPLMTDSRKLQLRLRAMRMTSGRTSLQCTWQTRRDVLFQHRRPDRRPRTVMCPLSNSRPTSSPAFSIKPVDVRRRLDIRAHVMVIREANAVRRACSARTPSCARRIRAIAPRA